MKEYEKREAKRGYYWSRTLNTSKPDYSYYFYFDSGNIVTIDSRRYYWQSVRPVRLSQN
jgi:hypothetical protein